MANVASTRVHKGRLRKCGNLYTKSEGTEYPARNYTVMDGHQNTKHVVKGEAKNSCIQEGWLPNLTIPLERSPFGTTARDEPLTLHTKVTLTAISHTSTLLRYYDHSSCTYRPAVCSPFMKSLDSSNPIEPRSRAILLNWPCTSVPIWVPPHTYT